MVWKCPFWFSSYRTIPRESRRESLTCALCQGHCGKFLNPKVYCGRCERMICARCFGVSSLLCSFFVVVHCKDCKSLDKQEDYIEDSLELLREGSMFVLHQRGGSTKIIWLHATVDDDAHPDLFSNGESDEEAARKRGGEDSELCNSRQPLCRCVVQWVDGAAPESGHVEKQMHALDFVAATDVNEQEENMFFSNYSSEEEREASFVLLSNDESLTMVIEATTREIKDSWKHAFQDFIDLHHENSQSRTSSRWS